MRWGGLLVLLAAACSKKDAVQQAPLSVTSAPSSEPALAASALPDVPKPHFERTFARFNKDVLAECSDFQVDLLSQGDGGDPTDGIAKNALKDKSLQEITKPCNESFADRTPLATCTVSKPVDGGTMSARGLFFDFGEVGLSDVHMRDCLKMKGEWSAIPRDSQEWRRAKLDHDTKALRKLTGQGF